MSKDSQASERVHSEAPAEGDETADPMDRRMHAQEPAEGADSDDDESPGDEGSGKTP